MTGAGTLSHNARIELPPSRILAIWIENVETRRVGAIGLLADQPYLV
jgi:hypothetical protein